MAISKGLLLAGLAASGLGLVAATSKKKPKPGEPGGPPASSLPGAEQVVPPEITSTMVKSLESGDPARIRATADILEKSGYKAQAADLRAGAVLIEKENSKKQADKLAQEAKDRAAAAAKQAEKVAAAAAAAVPSDISSSAAVQTAVKKAIATGSASTMRTVAKKLRDLGATQAAVSLETAATAIEARQLADLAAATSAPAAAAPAPVTPASVIPAVVDAVTKATKATPTRATPVAVSTSTAPVSTGPTKAERAALAGQVALAMKGAKKGKENKAIVTAYQKQEKLPKKDGLYGSTVALSLADTFGIVPPKPLYWGTKAGGYASYVQDKKDYKAALLTKAARDPTRSEEWTRAANV